MIEMLAVFIRFHSKSEFSLPRLRLALFYYLSSRKHNREHYKCFGGAIIADLITKIIVTIISTPREVRGY